jgi:hypothetical protein
MVRSITKDTVLCMSLAGRPSNIGTRWPRAGAEASAARAAGSHIG